MPKLIPVTSLLLFLFAPLLASFNACAQNLNAHNFNDLARVLSPSPSQASRFNLQSSMARISNGIAVNTPYKTVAKWHLVLLEILAYDHIPIYTGSGDSLTFQQFGPHRASYASAMVHLAMFEAADAYSNKYKSWLASKISTPLQPPSNITSSAEMAALEAAAYTMIAHLYPHYSAAVYDLATTCTKTPKTQSEADGCAEGLKIAQSVIGARGIDGSSVPDGTFGDDQVKVQRLADGSIKAGTWSPDPVSNLQVALGPRWGEVKTFVLTAHPSDDLPCPPKYAGCTSKNGALSDADYKAALREVAAAGHDPRRHYSPLPTGSDDQRAKRDIVFDYYMGKFWSYDGTPGLCAPVRLYNQIADMVWKENINNPNYNKRLGHESSIDLARYYAILNLALADAGIEAWRGKYKYLYWRPITGVRAAAPATGGNLTTPQHFTELWYPLGAQTSNAASGYNVTPAFPAYPSGHSVFGSAFFEVLRQLVPNDQGFQIASDELKKGAQTVDAQNFIRCMDGDLNDDFCAGIKFKSFSLAEKCNSRSRIWLGVHWSFDAEQGEKLGRTIGRSVWSSLQPKSNMQPLNAEAPSNTQCSADALNFQNSPPEPF